MNKVLIVGSSGNCQYSQMFKSEGWELVSQMEQADLIQFTGGADVSPDLYGSGKHPRTGNDPQRDRMEESFYKRALQLALPMAGICRGGQFLNVMNGGRMYQHVDGHAVGKTHNLYDTQIEYSCKVTSTHHQMMIAHKRGRIIGLPMKTLCTRKEYVDRDGKIFVVEPDGKENDTEVVYYPDTDCLCFQPHPEFEAGKECRPYYFAQIEGRLLGNFTRMEALLGCDAIRDNEDGFIEPFFNDEEY